MEIVRLLFALSLGIAMGGMIREKQSRKKNSAPVRQRIKIRKSQENILNQIIRVIQIFGLPFMVGTYRCNLDEPTVVSVLWKYHANSEIRVIKICIDNTENLLIASTPDLGHYHGNDPYQRRIFFSDLKQFLQEYKPRYKPPVA